MDAPHLKEAAAVAGDSLLASALEAGKISASPSATAAVRSVSLSDFAFFMCMPPVMC